MPKKVLFETLCKLKHHHLENTYDKKNVYFTNTKAYFSTHFQNRRDFKTFKHRV